jgi:2-hydroxychromene-2-carboxylate isomerase
MERTFLPGWKIAAHYRQERRPGKALVQSAVWEREEGTMNAGRPRIEFWHELASTYSYLSAMRIEALASVGGVVIEWKPLLLGPIFRTQGWDTSPFNIYPAKGRYMVRDMERLASARGLTFRLPSPFPQNSLHAARLALVGHVEGWGVAFTRAVYEAQFGEGASIGDKRVLLEILDRLGLEADAVLARSETAETKQRLRQQTEDAQELGIFGAPSFLARGELFWGDDRLEQALAAATAGEQKSKDPA